MHISPVSTITTATCYLSTWIRERCAIRFETTRDNLLAGITIVHRAVATRSPMPVLSGILIEAQENALRLTGTDLELSITYSVPAEVIAPGTIVLPARYLSDIVRRLPAGRVGVMADLSSSNVTLRYGRAEAHLIGFNADEFPRLPEVTPKIELTLDGELLREVIKQVVYAVGQDELRPIFTGVLLEVADEELRAVATDTHRLALRRSELAGYEGQLTNIVVPGKALSELSRILAGGEEEVRVAVAENYIALDSGAIRMTSRLIDGQYPDYRQVIPGSYRTRISGMDTDELLRTVERVAIMSREDGPVILLENSDGTLVISAQCQAGSIREELPATIEGEDFKVAINATYIAEALKASASQEITLELNGNYGPAIIRSKDNLDYLALILPIRLA
ncbi:MAG: DNA polymerase III subunit beta [Peptococcaceae bacterium]|nr:DNA polymerase III subunit beta [Peptococcaceae bacterium]